LIADDTLDDLLNISAANMPLRDFNPNEAINFWWAVRSDVQIRVLK